MASDAEGDSPEPGAGPGAELDALMLSTQQNGLGRFSNAKSTLRFYLSNRKRMIDEGRDFDLVTAQGLWYLVEPYIPKKKNGEYVLRDNFVAYIREICKEPELNCRREDLKIVSGERADLYFNGEWTHIAWENLEELSKNGTDGILIEKEGMSRILADFVDPHGVAVINTRGFFVDYLGDISKISLDAKMNLVLIRDFDPSGLVIEQKAKALGITCIGVNDEMLDFLGLTRDQVKDKHPPSKGNNHWTKILKDAETDPELAKEISFLTEYRIEIDKIHVTVGSRRLWEYVKYKLEILERDLNRVALPPMYVQPYALSELAYELKRVGQPSGRTKAVEIYREQSDWDGGLCDNVEERRKNNSNEVRWIVELNEDIQWAITQINPIVDKLKQIIVEEEEEDEEDTDDAE